MATTKSKQNKLDAFIDGQYQTLDPKVKFFILALCFLLPLILAYYLFYQPHTKEQERLKKEIEAVQADIRKVEAVLAELPKFKAEVEEVRRKFEETKILLPTAQEIPALLRNIADLGKAAGLEVRSFAPQASSRREFYAEIPIAIQVYGPYHNVGLFLDKVSKLERIVTLDNLSMASPKHENGEILLTSAGKLVTYQFIDDAPKATGAK